MNMDAGIARGSVASVHATESAVSWGAVLAGASAAAALSLMMLVLGTGLGLSSVSPWAMDGVSAAKFGMATILWITLTQSLASGMGGYIAGRLRSRWDGVHSDEVHFRDTAHGFLAWVVASLATAALLTSVAGAIVSGASRAAATVAGGAASTAMVAGAAASSDDKEGSSYFADSLLRSTAPPAPPAPPAPADAAAPASPAAAGPPAAGTSPEVTRQVASVLVHSIQSDSLSPDDLHYLGQLVAQRRGLSQADAEQKVSDVFNTLQTKARDAATKAKETADAARKASTKAALWLFISLLIGAFIASLAALFGGRHRIA